jgi:hypothetical protein
MDACQLGFRRAPDSDVYSADSKWNVDKQRTPFWILRTIVDNQLPYLFVKEIWNGRTGGNKANTNEMKPDNVTFLSQRAPIERIARTGLEFTLQILRKNAE